MTLNTDPLDSGESGKLRGVEARLIARFSPPLRPEDVQRCLLETIVSFQDARVRTYLSVLVERVAADRLQAAALAAASVETWVTAEVELPSSATAQPVPIGGD